MTLDKQTLAVLIPFYNEQSNLKHTLQLISDIEKKEDFKIYTILHDDNSTDNSIEIIEGFKKNSEINIILISNSNENLGHGKSLIRLSKECLNMNNIDFVLTMDSDIKLESGELLSLLSLKNEGLIIGKRNRFNDGFFRGGITILLEVLFFITLFRIWRDVNCPLRLYTFKNFNKIWSEIPSETTIPNIFSTKEVLKQNIKVSRYKYKENLVGNNQGVTWGNKSLLKKYKKILNFCFHAAKEFIKN
tara:strand:+ start:14355 stop:15092 length:738 start_codon:yes stop_codon:yes gene_type:complete